jgi:uncharacterized membrane protein
MFKHKQQLLSLMQVVSQIVLDQTLILAVFSLFNLGLLAIRVHYSQEITFVFLIWNLFLAWIPYLASLLLHRCRFKTSNWPFIVLLLAFWLSFLPNAPYILTDLIHLKPRPPLPLWYDLTLLLSFAVNGLLLALTSISDIQDYLNSHFSTWLSSVFIAVSLLSTSYGIYLGRVLRWNSWNLLTHPKQIVKTFVKQLLQSSLTSTAVYMTGFFFVFLSLNYLGYRVLRYKKHCVSKA